MRRAAVRKATCCSPCRCMGICETPHDLRPEHAALPALLVFAQRLFADCADKELISMLLHGIQMKTEGLSHQIVLSTGLNE